VKNRTALLFSAEHLQKEAQLPQKDRAMVCVIVYVGKVTQVIENNTIRKLGYGVLFAFHE